MGDLMQSFGEQFGLVPLYAVIIAYAAYSANNFKHLTMMLSILSGLYITMFKAFGLKAKFGVFDVTQYFPVSQDVGNMVVAVIFVYAIGYGIFALKRAFTARTA